MQKKTFSPSEEGARAVEKYAAVPQFERAIERLGGQLLDNPFMVARSGLIAKLLFLHDVYGRIKDVPGDIIELGVWLGQSLVMFENLRAIHEPFNSCRTIYGFDTFEGYVETSDLPIAQSEIDKYTQPESWQEEIEALFAAHCSINNSNTKLELIKGDIRETLPEFSESYNGFAACIFVDIATFETTEIAITFANEHLVKGGVLVIDDYGDTYPGVMKSLKANGIGDYECELNPYFKTKLLLWKK
ncbi:class I SAM-dependent methyltransferase [Kiloniella sp. EL199]|uniref:class I SAM-dependent methyltransferase n=1 Tax=Kiloniella sp. EL199 TaxID=2107581 RepID=UPI000EA197EB|nr:class I SAM-dependent methyltransferase [Kiloniella sp. EL199]